MSIDIGVMLRGQYPFGVDMAHMAEDLLEQARLADRLGYDSITKGSHYSTPDYQALQQIPLLARLTGEVKRARLNAGIVILPLHKPRFSRTTSHFRHFMQRKAYFWCWYWLQGS